MRRPATDLVALTLISLVLVGGLFFVLVRAARAAPAEVAVLTFYHWTGNPMASGIYPAEGYAACSYHYPLGTVLRLTGGGESHDVVCADRGDLYPWKYGIYGVNAWVDVYAPTAGYGYAVQARVGWQDQGGWTFTTVTAVGRAW